MRALPAVAVLLLIILITPGATTPASGAATLPHPLFERLAQIDPPPGIYATLSLQAYEDGGGTPPRGWIVLVESTGISTEGYHGVAYANPTTKQMVIAHRGTDFFTGDTDLDDDILLKLDQVPGQYEEAAKPFIRLALNFYEQYFGQPALEHTSFTGHSLGAVLAELAAHEFRRSAVTFESPGSDPILVEMGRTPDNQRVISFQAAPNAVNRANAHVGQIYRVYPPHEQTNGAIPQVLLRHSMERLAATFDPTTGLPFVASDEGLGGWDGLGAGGLLVDADFDLMPHYWWSVHLASLPLADKLEFLSDRLEGVQSDPPTGIEIIGDNHPNQIVDDTTGPDTLRGYGGPDEIASYGGDDLLDGGTGGDLFRIINVPGTRGERTILAVEAGDLLIWDGVTVGGAATSLGGGAYQLTGMGDTGVTFRLVAQAGRLSVRKEGDSLNIVTLAGYDNGDMGIYLDTAPLASCPNGVTKYGTESGPEELFGTCGPDTISGELFVFSQEPNLDDVIFGLAGNDTIWTDNAAWSVVGRNIAVGGPGNDSIYSHAGDDVLYGDEGDDGIGGGLGYDVAYGGPGNDVMAYVELGMGGPGNDSFTVANAGIQQFGQEGADLFTMMQALYDTSSSAPTILSGGPGDDGFLVAYLIDGGPPARPPTSSTVVLNGGSGQNIYVIPTEALAGKLTVRLYPGEGEEYAASRIYVAVMLSRNSDGTYWLPEWATPLRNNSAYTLRYRPDGSLQILRAGAALAQTSAGGFVIENFHNGMFGLTGVAGAPTLAALPWAPDEGASPGPTDNRLYLPLMRRVN